MAHFSFLSLLQNALTGNKGWSEQWLDAQPKRKYDTIIVGGVSHRISAAYCRVKDHGITNVAVIAKGLARRWHTGHNTAIIR